MPDPFDILDALTPERFCSGEVLASRHGVSRMAVWKAIRRLESLGVPIEKVRGRGYRLARPVERLRVDEIRRSTAQDCLVMLDELQVVPLLDSTNRHLSAAYAPDRPARAAVLAEFQTDGRGRRGRRWISPFAANIYLSLRWQFHAPAAALGLLSLAVASELAAELARLGLSGHGVKWPNDLYWQGRKLGGLLLELSGEQQGPCAVVIGLGLNWSMPVAVAAEIDQPWTDIQTAMGSEAPGRNALAGRALTALIAACQRYAQSGFEGFAEQWEAHDLVRGRLVDVHHGGRVTRGRALGIDTQGRLELACEDRVLSFSSGEVSVRAAP